MYQNGFINVPIIIAQIIYKCVLSVELHKYILDF